MGEKKQNHRYVLHVEITLFYLDQLDDQAYEMQAHTMKTYSTLLESF